MGVEEIAHDATKPSADRVQVALEQVYRTKDRLYIRYSVANQSKSSVPGHDTRMCAPRFRPSSPSRS